MRIAFLTPEYVTESNFDGGLANYLYRVSKILHQRGHHIEIFTSSDRNEIIVHEGIVIHRIKAECSIIEFINYLTKQKFKKSIFVLSLSYCLRKNLIKRHREEHFDIIQSSSYLSVGLLSTFFRPASIVTRISSYEPLMRKFYHKRLTFDQRLLEWLEIYSLSRSNAVYGPSEFISRILNEKVKIKADVLYPPFLLETNDFDRSIFQRNLAGKKYLIFFGTIGVLKGCEVLARILPIILSQYPEMHFVFIGKDTVYHRGRSMIQYIFQQAEYHKDQIIYLGVLHHSQLYHIVECSQAVVLPSLFDTLSNAMLEAMALGKVVIGTKGTSFEEFIEDGISGILVERNDPIGLIKAMQRVWSMTEKERENIGKSAQESIAELSPEKTCICMEQYFERKLDHR